MATWPSSLPSPELGAKLEQLEQTLRTDMEAGYPRQRRITQQRVDTLALTWKLTDAQMDTFREWFDDPAEGKGGAAWFTITLPLGNGGTQNATARFVGAWTATILPGLNWQLAATLEVR
jgi:hypothetical protein